MRTNDSHADGPFAAQVMSFMGRPAKRRNYGKTRVAVATVARERIEILLDQAKQMARTNEKLSRRYVQLARRISKRTKVRIPVELKRYLCKSCGIPLIPGYNVRMRLHARNTGIVITCLSCGKVKRYPVKSRMTTGNARIAMKPYISESVPFPKENSSKE